MEMKIMKTTLIYSLLFILCSCGSSSSHQQVAANLERNGEYELIASRHLINDIQAQNNDGTVNVLVEIPTGTNQKWEVDHFSGHLKWEFENGVPRVVKYLGYPGNYGFIPQTSLPKDLGGDGDPLDILVLGQAVSRGTILKTKIIGVLRMLDRAEQDDKLIAVRKGTPFFEINDLKQLNKEFPGITKIIKTWFQNYKGKNKIKILGTRGKKSAARILKQAMIQFKPYTPH